MKKKFCILLCLLLAFSFVLPAVGDSKLTFLNEHIHPLDPKDIPAMPSGMHHYLLICMDNWQNNLKSPGYNDGMVLLTLDEATGRVIISSFIRDMWVKHEDGKVGRINRAIRKGGPEGLMQTINRHFGLQVDKYIMMDWRHIMEILDAVGGIDVELTESEVQYLKNWSVPESSTNPKLKHAGRYHLNGFSGVIYMRIRKRRSINDVETQDFGRNFRVRSVLGDIAKKISGYSLSQAEDLLYKLLEILEAPYETNYRYPGVKRETLFNSSPASPGKKRSQTNITSADILEALSVAYGLKDSRVESLRLPFDGTVSAYEYSGNAGQYVDFEKNRRRLREFMFENSYVVFEGEK